MRVSTPLLLFALFAALLLTATPVAAQDTGTIRGTVTDAETGEPLPGANVVATEAGVVGAADGDGVYEITGLNAGEYTLRVTFIGYQEAELTAAVRAGQTTERDIQLSPGVELEEVVVTALGIERETRSLGYSVQEVDGRQVAEAGESNIVNALAAKTAGVQITGSSGQPGKSARITIRGTSSLLGDNQPLFIVDGVPISNAEDENQAGPGVSQVLVGGTVNRALDIDPNIIEDVTILKGASATALYGSRASNGAVVITTKNGRTGQSRPRITLSSRVRFDQNVIDGFQDQYLQGQNGFFQNGLPTGRGGFVQDGAVDIFGNPVTTPTTDLNFGPHKDEVPQSVLDALGVDAIQTFDPRADYFRTGAVAENSISVAGGAGNNANYFLSASDLRQEGTVPGTDLNRTSLMAKFGISFTDRFRAESSANYVRTANTYLLEGNQPLGPWYTLLRAPISYDLNPATFEDGSQRLFSSSESRNNPYWLSENARYTSDVDRLIGNTSVSFDLLPGVTLSERLGIDTYNDTRLEKVNIGARSQRQGSLYDQKLTRTEINSDLTLQVDRELGSDFRLSGTLGNNINSRYFQYNFIQGRGLSQPGFYNIANASTVTGEEQRERRLLVSAYGQATLDYQDWAYLTLTGRNDWSSTLPSDNNSYFYPSASLGLVFTEAFSGVFDRTPVSFGKLRLSTAQVGSDAPVHSLSTFYLQAAPGDGERGEINFPFNGTNGFVLDLDLGNPDLKPEISTEYEVGLDLRLLGDRARIDAAYYTRSTRNQIFEVPVSATTGFNSRLINAGEIENRGYEITLGGTPLLTSSFQWDLQLNFTKNTTEVVELAEGLDNIYLFGFTSPQIRILPEENGYGVIWGPTLLRNSMLDEPFEGVDGDALIIDEDGLPVQTGQSGPIGNVQPDWLANLRTSLGFRGLNLSALFDVRRGGDVLNFDLFYSVFAGTAELTENRGTETVWDGVNVDTGEPNDVAVMQDESYYRIFYSSFNSTELFVEDGSYVKLRELSLSYDLPARWLQPIGLQSARLTGIGRNLWIGSDFTYRDPEGSLAGSGNGQGFYHGVIPSTRSYSIGVDLTF